MTAMTWTPKPVEIPGTQLEYVGPYGLVTVKQLPLITLTADWYEDLRVVARNGRRRNLITIPGHGKGVKPASAGKTYPPDPLTTEEMLDRMGEAAPESRMGATELLVRFRTGAEANGNGAVGAARR